MEKKIEEKIICARRSARGHKSKFSKQKLLDFESQSSFFFHEILIYDQIYLIINFIFFLDISTKIYCHLAGIFHYDIFILSSQNIKILLLYCPKKHERIIKWEPEGCNL